MIWRAGTAELNAAADRGLALVTLRLPSERSAVMMATRRS